MMAKWRLNDVQRNTILAVLRQRLTLVQVLHIVFLI